ncbi:fungal-specific transcription factor domain protein [Aspergillus sclerotioniger CBS 115572]|uniref:Fungal-specific transcription factor domain protein n=1 Tax=Aspergillus sclerotioniger CBS 115572 TaxID=1450535 RepID=A0A317XDH5_9EURO|nr:fungal-specific transcription factor domain protein [Aspergillus sclerotioniger CBS 115572]PWY96221.1 fungal-specific transcription factor domain protein [Aspergillus sclerotioniger CBS 115572]
MSPTDQRPPAASSRAAAKPHRALACVLCQQRKVKCDRKFPCASCVRAGAQCVPTLAPRPRRRRFPERELLERLRRYEDLLRHNGIDFEPLHTSVTEKGSQEEVSGGRGSVDDEDLQGPGSGTARGSVKTEPVYTAKNFWQLMNQLTLDTEDGESDDGSDDDYDGNHSHDTVHEAVVKKTWDQVYDDNDQNLLFGSCKTNVDLSTLHPDQVQIFKLWLIYLENVDPLLKVTHTPTLQMRIIDAVGNIGHISPTLEALMFGIYSVAIMSLPEDECPTLLGAPKRELLKGYQFGCQQALLKCDVLRSGDRDCLTALLLYLISARPETDPRSLSSMLGVAIRNAQRMHIDTESANAKCTALEGEIRRRLWWSLVTFDNRIGEMSDHKTSMLIPTWDCKTPLNVNDFDLQPEMKNPAAAHEGPTEALFAVVRSELGEFIRHSACHLDFTNPSLKAIAKNLNGDGVSALESSIEDKHLRFCNPEIPLHYMTIWTARGFLAKYLLVEHYSTCSPAQQTDAQRDAASTYALRMIECDTKLMTSPLTKRYSWHVHFHFPFPAYLHIIQALKKRPTEHHADKMWNVMSENYEARFNGMEAPNPIFMLFARSILQVWEVYEAAYKQLGQMASPPLIVLRIKTRLSEATSNTAQCTVEHAADIPDSLQLPMSTDYGIHDPPYGIEGLDVYPDVFEQAAMDVDAYLSDWPSMNFYPMW